MDKSKRLAPIVHLESVKEQQAAKGLAAAKQRLQQDSKKLEDLLAYAGEYQGMVEQEGRGGIQAQRLHAYHQFVNRLMVAVEEQKEQVNLSQGAVEHAEQDWFRQRGAHQNMSKLVSRYAQGERQAADRREQVAQDEMVQLRRPAFADS